MTDTGTISAGTISAGSDAFASVDDLLADARSRFVRVSVPETVQALRDGARLVDIRPAWQRAQEGEIPGSLIVERNHLEWRLHPASAARLPWASPGQRWIVLCSEGYTSSLAAAALVSLGVPATDLIGGLHAWREAGLAVTAGPSPIEQIVGEHAGQPTDQPGDERLHASTSIQLLHVAS
ncbi:rhodanese-like domain-containing protein [Jatrophihabitans sp. DSM 45814]